MNTASKQAFASAIIFLQSLAGMVGSLYFQYVKDWPPCDLCWYQRILLYPIVFISFVGILKKDHRFVDYVLPLSILGMVVAAYQYSLRWFPPLICSADVPCDAIYFEWFGFIDIPFLSFVAFFVITVMVIWKMKMSRSHH